MIDTWQTDFFFCKVISVIEEVTSHWIFFFMGPYNILLTVIIAVVSDISIIVNVFYHIIVP